MFASDKNFNDVYFYQNRVNVNNGYFEAPARLVMIKELITAKCEDEER